MATRLVALLVFTKRSDGLFLIYVVIISSSTFYLSKLTKFELIITIFEHNCVYLSSQN